MLHSRTLRFSSTRPSASPALLAACLTRCRATEAPISLPSSLVRSPSLSNRYTKAKPLGLLLRMRSDISRIGPGSDWDYTGDIDILIERLWSMLLAHGEPLLVRRGLYPFEGLPVWTSRTTRSVLVNRVYVLAGILRLEASRPEALRSLCAILMRYVCKIFSPRKAGTHGQGCLNRSTRFSSGTG